MPGDTDETCLDSSENAMASVSRELCSITWRCGVSTCNGIVKELNEERRENAHEPP